MKTVFSVLLLLLMILGVGRAFQFEESNVELLSTRQKIEITYRNATAFQTDAETLKIAENEINELVKRDPFLKKKDRLWVNLKLKNLRTENPGSLAMGSER